jgi:hypothetical protein
VTADPWPGTLHGAHHDRSALAPAPRRAPTELGRLSPESIRHSAGEHRLTENEVFGVVSFHKTLSGAAGGERP